MLRLLLVRGLPGSGKSTKARELSMANDIPWIEVDTYISDLTILHGIEHRDDPSKVQRRNIRLKGHFLCNWRAEDYLSKGKSVVVSNCNLDLKNMYRYFATASKYNAVVEIRESSAEWKNDVVECAAHNENGVTLKCITKYADRYVHIPEGRYNVAQLIKDDAGKQVILRSLGNEPVEYKLVQLRGKKCTITPIVKF